MYKSYRVESKKKTCSARALGDNKVAPAVIFGVGTRSSTSKSLNGGLHFLKMRSELLVHVYVIYTREWKRFKSA